MGEELIKDFLGQKYFAVIGSFRNPGKVAYRILMTLKEKGYVVYPVNPKTKAVEGLVCYASIKDIPAQIDVADMVTPPAITEKIVRECREKGIKRVWFQPGAESEEAVKFCDENGIKSVHGICLMAKASNAGARP
ncbi:MAG: hypothetical protein A2Z72_06975 [Omnitrophica bacterium RBG_13_46_9]|nr:MAG: hypothetical protein A2Z72_06975 [Omnitrophica bacterium RBG_13_46_9]